LRGKHSFKYGFQFSHIEGDSDAHDTRGRIDFLGGQQTIAGNPSTALEDFFAGLPGRGQQLVGNPSVRVISKVYGVFAQDDYRLTPKLILNLGLRWSYATPFHEVNNQLGGFSPTLGMVQEGQGPNGNYLWKPDHGNWSPRIGFAYDVTGKGTTVVRGGASILYSMFSLAPFSGNPGIANVPGTSIAADPTGACNKKVPIGQTCSGVGGQTFGGTIATGTAKIPPSALNWNGVVFPGGAQVSCTAAARCSLGTVDPNLKTPFVYNWSLGVQHAFNSNLSLDVEYVGTRAGHLIGSIDLNQVNSAGVLPYAASFPYLQFINWTTNFAYSHYNSLQTTLTQRLSHGFTLTAGYTYGHGLDNGSLNRFAGQPQNSYDPAAEYSNSDFDIRHRATFTASYDIPGKKGYGQLLEGWKLNTIITISGSQPWNIIDGSDNFTGSSENTDRWDFFGNPSDFKATSSSIPYCSGFGSAAGVTCSQTSGVSQIKTILPSSLGAKCTAVAPDPTTLATGGCFVDGNSVMTPPVAGTFGTMGRNIFRDTGFKNVDFSVFKNFKFTERFNAQFRAEFFNFLNHPQIANPFGSVNGYAGGSDPSANASFGCGCTTPDIAAGNPIVGSGDARTIQLGFKLLF